MNGRHTNRLVDWLFGLNCSLRQHISLYRVVFQREGERKEKRIGDRRKLSEQLLSAPTASTVGTCPAIIQLGVPALKITQHYRLQTERSYFIRNKKKNNKKKTSSKMCL